MLDWLARFVRIDWSRFGRTGHWLRGTALTDYLLRESYVPVLRSALYEESPFLARLNARRG